MSDKISTTTADLALLIQRIVAAHGAVDFQIELRATVYTPDGKIEVDTNVDDRLDRVAPGRPLAFIKLEKNDEHDDDAYRQATPQENHQLKALLSKAGYPITPPHPALEGFDGFCIDRPGLLW